MNDPRPGFLFNVVEFWTSEKVDGMEADAVGVYLFLLSRQWMNGSIPGDRAEIERMVRRLLVRPFDVVWPQVEACLPLCSDGRRRNTRLERERAIADRKSKQASGAVKARWDSWRAEQGQSTSADGEIDESDPSIRPDRRLESANGAATITPSDDPKNKDPDTTAIRSYNDRSSTELPRARGTGTGTGIINPPCCPPSQGGETNGGVSPRQRRAERAGELASEVLARDRYAPLRASPAFAKAWADWLSWCSTPKARGRLPASTLQAERMFDRALAIGPERYASAIDAAIEGDWPRIVAPGNDSAPAPPKATPQPRSTARETEDQRRSEDELCVRWATDPQAAQRERRARFNPDGTRMNDAQVQRVIDRGRELIAQRESSGVPA